MKGSPPFAAVAFGFAVCVSAVPFPAATTSAPTKPASIDVFHRAVNPDPGLKSYIASATLVAKMVSPLPLRKTLNGTAYFLRPNLHIVFTNVPNSLRQFKELSASAASYEGADYTTTPGTDDGTSSTFTLVPKKDGARVKQIVMKVDDAAARIVEADWQYNDGSTLSVQPTYSTVDGLRVMSQQQITAHFPHYRVAGTLTLSNYQMNAKVDPSMFATAAVPGE